VGKNTARGVVTDKYGMTIVDLNKIGYKDEPFVLANDVTIFYVIDMSSILQIKKADDKKITDNEPKRHIVLPGK
jgi:hypothetical protein